MRPAFRHYLAQTWGRRSVLAGQRDAPAQTPAPAATPEGRYAMPAPLTGNAVTGTVDQAGAPGTSAPAPVTPGHGPRKARALLPRRAARRPQTALPAAARSDITSSAGVETRGDRLRRVAGLLRGMPRDRKSVV